MLAREAETQRDVDPLAGRYWLVVNPGATNALSGPTAYKLVPGEEVRALAHPEQRAVRRLHRPPSVGDCLRGERAPLVNTDVVFRYSLGVHHVVRPEDRPVAPVAYAGFSLKPAGFFDPNPALDVPAPAHHGDGHCHA